MVLGFDLMVAVDTDGHGVLELMADHHRGGIHMASFAADRAEDAGVRELAERMATNQGFEINELIQAAERDSLDVDIEPYRITADHHDG